MGVIQKLKSLFGIIDNTSYLQIDRKGSLTEAVKKRSSKQDTRKSSKQSEVDYEYEQAKKRDAEKERKREPRLKPAICFKCKKQCNGLTGIFECHYCGRDFCEDHRLPENHNCIGDPSSPPGGMRELYSRGKTTVISK